MAKFEISNWEIAEKLGLCRVADEEILDKWHSTVIYNVYYFHGKKIRIEDNMYTRQEIDFNERAAEIVLFQLGKQLALHMTDWVE